MTYANEFGEVYPHSTYTKEREKQVFMNNKCQYYHSPDVLERETSDGGFSRGWGMHFVPAEEYWTDFHTHLETENSNDSTKALQIFKDVADRRNVKYTAVIIRNIPLHNGEKPDGSFLKTALRDIATVRETDGLIPMLYIDYRDACEGTGADIIDEAAEAGVKALKLHNAPIIVEGADHRGWLSDEWGKVFERIGKYRLPVLWHVTQRLTDSPYTGGGRNTYWKDGWLKGVKYSNQDLLEVFLEVVGRFPGISFVGAHQLHMGWEQVGELFEKYPNLLVDTSCGCIVREFDRISRPDSDYIREFFVKYDKRLLFGTDTLIRTENSGHYVDANFAEHMRFIKQLELPYDGLQSVTHGNFEKLMGLI